MGAAATVASGLPGSATLAGLLPVDPWGVLGLSIAALVGTIAWATASVAGDRRWSALDAAFAGSAAATLLAPPPLAGLSPLLPLLALASLLSARGVVRPANDNRPIRLTSWRALYERSGGALPHPPVLAPPPEVTPSSG